LSQIRGLRVISRTSVNHYKNTTKPVPQIGQELGVDSVLEGSVRKAGDQLRITAQLIDTRTDDHRWAQTYDRKLENVFAIQAEVAEQTAKALRLELLGSDRAGIRRGPTSDLEAYELFLKGISAFQQTADEGWTRQGAMAAAGYFEAAIAKDPGLSPAYSYMANLLIAAGGESIPTAEVAPQVRMLVTKSLELDPTSADAHVARGNLALQIEFDWVTAEREFSKAIELNPSSMPAHAWYGILLHTLGRPEEAIQQFKVAADLDPFFQNLTFWQIIVLRDTGDLDSAAAVCRRALEQSPGNRVLHANLGQVYFLMGRLEDARREAKLAEGPMAGAGAATTRATLLARLGEPGEARRIVEAWESSPSNPERYVRLGYVARVLIALGEYERALDVLETDRREGDRSLWMDFRNRDFDPVRNEPRFLALLREMKLPVTARPSTAGESP
jgi:adenylate cyclase